MSAHLGGRREVWREEEEKEEGGGRKEEGGRRRKKHERRSRKVREGGTRMQTIEVRE
jgi:hypothetical protein